MINEDFLLAFLMVLFTSVIIVSTKPKIANDYLISATTTTNESSKFEMNLF